MDKLYVFRAPCRKSLRVTPDGASFTLAEPCLPCNIAEGSALQCLIDACNSCTVRSCTVEGQPMNPSSPSSGGNGSPGSLPRIFAPPPGATSPAVEQGPLPTPVLPTAPVEAMAPPVAEPAPAQPAQPAQPIVEPMPMTQVQIVVPGSPVSPAPVVTPVQAAPPVDMSQPAQMSQPGTPASALLTGLLRGMGGGEESVDVDKVLASVPGLAGGPSEGGFSWHTLEPCMQCWQKAYLTHVLGLTPKQKSHALAFGSVYHACWEVWYTSGGQRRYDEPCDALRQAGAPKLAGDVQRLVYTELMKYAQEEATRWDIRAIEQNAIYWGEPERINGKLVHIPFSCRHDMLIAKRDEGAAVSPPGPVPAGIWIVDRKTSSALTYDLTKGYAMDGQFLMNALVFTRSDEVERFGPFQGMIFSVAVKHKEPSAEKSYFRVETTVDEPTIEEFYRDEVRPYAIELYRRLTSAEYRTNPRLWPKNRAACVGRYGCCWFFDICDVGGQSLIDVMFDSDPKRVFDVERLAEPPTEVRRAARAGDPTKQAAEEARKSKAEHKKQLAKGLCEKLRAALLQMEHFARSRYLVPNHTRKTVLDQLILTLQGLWPNDTKFNFGPDANGALDPDGLNFEVTVTEKGLAWIWMQPAAEGKKKPSPVKGVLNYKIIAESICADWWDLKNLEAKGRA